MASNEEYLDNLLKSVLQPASADSQPEEENQENVGFAEASEESGQVFDVFEEIKENEGNSGQQLDQAMLKELEIPTENDIQEEHNYLEGLDVLEPLKELSEFDNPDDQDLLLNKEVPERIENDFEDNLTEKQEPQQDQDIESNLDELLDFDSVSDLQETLSDYDLLLKENENSEEYILPEPIDKLLVHGTPEENGNLSNNEIELPYDSEEQSFSEQPEENGNVSNNEIELPYDSEEQSFSEQPEENGNLSDNEIELPYDSEEKPFSELPEEHGNLGDNEIKLPYDSEELSIHETLEGFEDLVEDRLTDIPEILSVQNPLKDESENSSERNISDIQDLLSDLDSLEEPDDIDFLSGDSAPETGPLLSERTETSPEMKGEENMDFSDFLSGLEDAEELPMTEKEAETNSNADDYQGMDMSDMDALLGAGFGNEDVLAPDMNDAMQKSSNLSSEEIENLLEANKASSQSANKADTEDMADISDLLNNEEDDEALQEITNLLNKSDANEAIDDDMLALLQSVSDEDQNTSGKEKKGEEDAFDLFAGDTPESPEDEKARKAAEKKAQKEAKKAAKLAAKKKRKQGQDTEDAQEVQQDENIGLSDIVLGDGEALPEGIEERPKKNKGFWTKIFEFLTVEDEDDEAQSLILSDENTGILREMDKDGNKGTKGKGANKKGNTSKGKEADGKDTEGKGGKGKEKKPKKEPKKKKEKPPKEPSEDNGKKLSGKRVGLIAFMCLTLGAAIFIMIKLSNDYSNKRNAQSAYYQEDYETCYQELFGKNRNESEEIMFYKSQSVLQLQMYLEKYEKYHTSGSRIEALDVLVQAVNDYPSYYENAAKWEYVDAIAPIYQNITRLLQEQFNLTEAQALEIAAQPDDVAYTKMILDIAVGGGSDQGNGTGATGTAEGV